MPRSTMSHMWVALVCMKTPGHVDGGGLSEGLALIQKGQVTVGIKEVAVRLGGRMVLQDVSWLRLLEEVRQLVWFFGWCR